MGPDVSFGHLQVCRGELCAQPKICGIARAGRELRFRTARCSASTRARLEPPGSPASRTTALCTVAQLTPGSSGIGPDFGDGHLPVRGAMGVRPGKDGRSTVKNGVFRANRASRSFLSSLLSVVPAVDHGCRL